MSGRPPTSVLHLIATDRPRGAERFAISLAAEMDTWGLRNSTAALERTGARVSLDVNTLGRGALAPKTLRQLVRHRRDASIVIAHGSKTLPACAITSAAAAPPFVYRSIGDPRAWALTSVARRTRVHLALRRARHVVALFPGAADVLVSRLGVPAERVSVIPTGRRVEDWCATPFEMRRQQASELGVPDGMRTAIYCGALAPEKNVALIIDAVRRLEDVYLLIVGDGPCREELRLRAQDLDGRIQFVGQVADTRPYLAAAEVLVLASLTEGLPGVLIEAGLMGLPAVTTDVGGAATIVRDRVSGVVVRDARPEPFARAIREALEQGSAYGQEARVHCRENFDIRLSAERWRELVHALV